MAKLLVAATTGDGLGDGEATGEGTLRPGLGDGSAAAGRGLGKTVGGAVSVAAGAGWLWQAVTSTSNTSAAAPRMFRTRLSIELAASQEGKWAA